MRTFDLKGSTFNRKVAINNNIDNFKKVLKDLDFFE